MWQFSKDFLFRPQSQPLAHPGNKSVMAKELALLLFADFTDLSYSVTYAGGKQSIGSDYSPSQEEFPVKLSCKNKALNN